MKIDGRNGRPSLGRHTHWNLHVSDYRTVSSGSGQSRILLGDTLLVAFSDTGHRRPHRFYPGESDFSVFPVGSLFVLLLLDHQGNLRTARTRTKRLVPDESETEKGIRTVKYISKRIESKSNIYILPDSILFI